MPAYLVRESLLGKRAGVDSLAAQSSPRGGSESTLHDVKGKKKGLEDNNKQLRCTLSNRRHVGGWWR
jgi:hypothetical protein